MPAEFLTAEWRKLAIVNYVVDPSILLPCIPYKTELDLWNNKCYISLVGFMFLNTKLKGIPVPFHRNFEEVNLRFYVKHKDSIGWKRGVTFIKEIVPKPALTLVANTFFKEKYVTRPMKHSWNINVAEIAVGYSWKYKGKWNEIKIISSPECEEIKPGSEEEFITEHYWGYTTVSSNKSSEYSVEHPKWKMYKVRNYNINVAFDQVYHKRFGILNDMEPVSVMLAEGSDISVGNKRSIR